jgi:hypothetical protein
VKHSEFVAVHKQTKTKVYVGAKSRRRPASGNFSQSRAGAFSICPVQRDLSLNQDCIWFLGGVALARNYGVTTSIEVLSNLKY